MLVTAIEKIAEDQGLDVDIKVSEPSATDKNDEIQKAPITLRYQSDLENSLEFINDLQQLPMHFEIHNLHLNVGLPSGDDILIVTSIEAVTYWK